jgi:hypothetical protein
MIKNLRRPLILGLVSSVVGFSVGFVPSESKADPDPCEFYTPYRCYDFGSPELGQPWGGCWSRSDGQLHSLYRITIFEGEEPVQVDCWQ